MRIASNYFPLFTPYIRSTSSILNPNFLIFPHLHVCTRHFIPETVFNIRVPARARVCVSISIMLHIDFDWR